MNALPTGPTSASHYTDVPYRASRWLDNFFIDEDQDVLSLTKRPIIIGLTEPNLTRRPQQPSGDYHAKQAVGTDLPSRSGRGGARGRGRSRRQAAARRGRYRSHPAVGHTTGQQQVRRARRSAKAARGVGRPGAGVVAQ